MALSPLGVLDLSIITDRLIAILTDAINHSPLWDTLVPPAQPPTIVVSGSMPDATRKGGNCQLGVCLVYVTQDKCLRNSLVLPPVTPPPLNPTPGRAQLIPSQPLSLNLYYLVTAYAEGRYVDEQQAMSIALKCFYENPIVRANVQIPGPPPVTVPEEFTLTMEVEANDELSRLWQSITVAYRLSVIYKVSVVFMTPPGPPPTAKPVTLAALSVNPASLPYASSGQVIGTSSTVSYATPASTVAKPDVVTFNYVPATVTPGQRFLLYGAGLDMPTASNIYLLSPDPASPARFIEQDITNWKAVPTDAQHPLHTNARITLDAPPTSGPLPANSPDPGIYQLRVGNNLPLTNSGAIRSNATPFSVAALVNVNVAKPNPPLLAPVGGTYTITGTKFISGQTEVLLDGIHLSQAANGLAAGLFKVVDLATITFQRPNDLRPGTYAVRIRVNQVESPLGWWIQF